MKKSKRKNNRIWIFIIVLIILGFVLSYSSEESFSIGKTNIKDILKNPENYEGKYVTIKGEFDTSLDGTYFIIDNQGYNIRFEPEMQRAFNLGQTYAIKGTVERKTKFVCDNEEYNEGSISGVKGSCEDVLLYWYLKESEN